MANDINGINGGRSSQTSDKQVQSLRRESGSGSARSSAGNPTATGQDKVSLTDMASRLKTLERKLADQPEVDQTRVDKVRHAMSRGEYRVNPDRVADKMMDFEADF